MKYESIYRKFYYKCYLSMNWSLIETLSNSMVSTFWKSMISCPNW